MNKIFLLVTITVFLLLAGCGEVAPNNTAQQNGQTPSVAAITNREVAKPSTTTNTPDLAAETKKQPYQIITATFSQDNIKIQYPQIKGLGDDSKEKTINDLVKSDLFKNGVVEPINFRGNDPLTMNWDYQVTMNTPELLSVVYTGNSRNERSAFPTDDIYAITIDLKNATKLKLSDITSIDTKLAQKIKQSTAVTNEAVKNGMDKNYLVSDIQDNDDQTLIDGLKEQWAYYTFYVTPNSLVVSVAVFHVAGDYALIELPGQYTKK